MDKRNYVSYLLVTAVALLFWTCAPKYSYRVKSFLFDGVPNPYEVKVSVITDSILKEDSISSKNSIAKKIARNEFNLHEPYRERKCATCHDRNNMGKPKMSIIALCAQCHDDFSQEYEVLHGPVATGNCTICHNPHQSKLNSLLQQDGQELCFKCHDANFTESSTIHKDIKDTNCTECHNPHGGNNNFNLQTESCYQCHDNFKKEYKFLHGPVASSDCSQCHTSHNAGTPKLLVEQGDKLCYQCHNILDVKRNEHHQKIAQSSCLSCHNPHGEKNHYLLNKQIVN